MEPFTMTTIDIQTAGLTAGSYWGGTSLLHFTGGDSGGKGWQSPQNTINDYAVSIAKPMGRTYSSISMPYYREASEINIFPFADNK